MKISEHVLQILSRVTIEGNLVFLTCGQLDRADYVAVNKVLENTGGKWNRKAKAHVYDSDPIEAIEQVLETGEITPPETYGYFPTPPDVVQVIMDHAEIMPGMRVLEPQAGRGAIAAAVPAECGLTMVELMEENCKYLSGDVLCGDFLTMEPDPVYHIVVMNPPFRTPGLPQADIDHVLHAYKFLKPGGRLVSVMSAGITFRENRKTADFREAIGDAEVITLPDGAFKASGTGVKTVLVVWDKR